MNYKEWLIAAIFSHAGELVVPDRYWKEQAGKWDIVRKDNSELKQVELKIIHKPQSGEAELPASDNTASVPCPFHYYGHKCKVGFIDKKCSYFSCQLYLTQHT